MMAAEEFDKHMSGKHIEGDVPADHVTVFGGSSDNSDNSDDPDGASLYLNPSCGINYKDYEIPQSLEFAENHTRTARSEADDTMSAQARPTYNYQGSLVPPTDSQEPQTNFDKLATSTKTTRLTSAQLAVAALAADAMMKNTGWETQMSKENYAQSYHGGQTRTQQTKASIAMSVNVGQGKRNAFHRRQKELESNKSARIREKNHELSRLNEARTVELRVRVAQQAEELKLLRAQGEQAQHDVYYQEMVRLGKLSKITICTRCFVDRRMVCGHVIDFFKYVWADAFGNLQRPDPFDAIHGGRDVRFEDPVESRLVSQCCIFMTVMLIGLLFGSFLWRFVVVPRAFGDEILIPTSVPVWSVKGGYMASHMKCDRVTEEHFQKRRLYNNVTNQFITFRRLQWGMQNIVDTSNGEIRGITGVHLDVLLNWCVLVIHRESGKTVTMFNPELTTRKSSTSNEAFESSIFCKDGVEVQIERPDSVEVDYRASDGKYHEKIYTQTDARVLSHLVDQLHGICPCT
jgi:peptide deformylase